MGYIGATGNWRCLGYLPNRLDIVEHVAISNEEGRRRHTAKRAVIIGEFFVFISPDFLELCFFYQDTETICRNL